MLTADEVEFAYEVRFNVKRLIRDLLKSIHICITFYSINKHFKYLFTFLGMEGISRQDRWFSISHTYVG